MSPVPPPLFFSRKFQLAWMPPEDPQYLDLLRMLKP